MKYKNKGFTLVELIVVITILAILATVGFISFQWYASQARDSTRLHNISVITNALEYYRVGWSQYPTPDNAINITLSGTVVGIQWDAWEKVLWTIGITAWWLDPVDGDYYSYFLSGDNTQVLAFMENDATQLTQSMNPTYAATDLESRYPYFKWKWLGMFLEPDNTPLHRSATIISGDFDVLSIEYANYLVKPLFTNNQNYTAKAIMVWWQLSLNSHVSEGNNCPEHFIPVPWNIELWQPPFCIWKYESSEWLWGYDSYITWPQLDVAVNLDINATEKECKGNGENYNIMTINQWLTIAYNIENEAVNWTWWSVGSGAIIWWNNWEDNRWLLKTGDTWSPLDSKRILYLSNWQEIRDFVWNAWEIVKPLNLYNVDLWANELRLIWTTNSILYDVLSEYIIEWLTLWSYTTWNDVTDADFKKMYWPKVAITPEQGWGKVLKIDEHSRIFAVWWDNNQNDRENWLFSIWILPHENYNHVGTRCAYNY